MKIGKNATIASTILGFLFIILGLYYLFNPIMFCVSDESNSEICMLSGVTVILWGGVMVLFGSIQYKEIKRGKEFEAPDKLMY